MRHDRRHGRLAHIGGACEERPFGRDGVRGPPRLRAVGRVGVAAGVLEDGRDGAETGAGGEPEECDRADEDLAIG